MWNFVNTMGHPGHFITPYNSQKRDFSLQAPSVAIMPGKSFTNPNFVNKHHPSVHSYQNNFISSPIEQISHIDSSPVSVSPLRNSSQSIVDTIKERHLDICKSIEPKSEVNSLADMCYYSRKRSKRNRRNHRRKSPGKSSRQNNSRQQINEMMEIDIELDQQMSTQDLGSSPRVPSSTCKLTDFIIEKVNKLSNSTKDICDSDEEDFVATIISMPPACSLTSMRQRVISACESEDSFIVFDSGTDEELDFSEASEESESDEEDNCDSPSSVIPNKRVRFAEDEELCQVHPMVHWSYAYQQARKGPWEQYGRDRDRFNTRILNTERILAPVFDKTHRETVYKERFQDNYVL